MTYRVLVLNLTKDTEKTFEFNTIEEAERFIQAIKTTVESCDITDKIEVYHTK